MRRGAPTYGAGSHRGGDNAWVTLLTPNGQPNADADLHLAKAGL